MIFIYLQIKSFIYYLLCTLNKSIILILKLELILKFKYNSFLLTYVHF